MQDNLENNFFSIASFKRSPYLGSDHKEIIV